MQQHTSSRAKVVGAFSGLRREMMQWCKEHLRRRKQAHNGNEVRLHRGSIDRCSMQPVHPGHAERPAVCTAAATAALTDLPANVLNHIISLADRSSILPLFRTSKLLRDAILGHVAVDGGAQLKTHLRIVTDMSPLQKGPQVHCGSSAGKQANALISIASPFDMAVPSASRLLQLAAQAAHDVCLHVQTSLPSDMAPQQMCWALSSSSLQGNTSDSSTRSIMAQFMASDWLSAMLKPWLSNRVQIQSMQHVTSIWLQDMALGHPMPECIGYACPALKSYGLHNVVWPVIKGTVNQVCWPHVQQLTLSDVYHPQLRLQFNPATLPHLDTLYIAWSHAYCLSQWKYYPHSTRKLGFCACTFQHQLISLTLMGLPWFVVMHKNEQVVFTRLSSLSINHPPSPDYCITFNHLLQYVVRFTPCLVRLHMNTIHLTEPCSRVQWSRLHTLRIDAFESELLPTLLCLPCMPALHMVTVPCGVAPVSVAVGSNWLADVASVLLSRDAERRHTGFVRRRVLHTCIGLGGLLERLGKRIHILCCVCDRTELTQ